MNQMGMSPMYGGRYGIWGESPVTERLDIVDPMQRGMDITKGIQGIFGNYYDNQKKGAEAGLKSNELNVSNQTMGDQIAATNAKNQADTKYYPLQQMYKTQQEEQTVKEIMSRTGFNYAQAKMALAHIPLLQAETEKTKASYMPGYTYDSVYKEMQNSPEGSPRKAYYANILNSMIGGQIPPTTPSKKQSSGGGIGLGGGGAAGGAGGAGGAIQPQQTTNGLQINPFTTSRQSNKGAQYIGQDDEGNPTVYTSPTQPSNTNLQSRLGAEAELKSLDPTFKGLDPYRSFYGAHFQYPLDIYKAKHGDAEAQARINKAEEAMQLAGENVILRLRQANPSAQVGTEMVNDQLKRMYPNMPSNLYRGFNSAENISKATEDVNSQLSNANAVAAQQSAENYPAQIPETPAWANNGMGNQSRGYIDPYSGNYMPPSQNANPVRSKTSNKGGSKSQRAPSDSDIEHTAKLYNISKAEVRRRLGLK